MRISDWSSDVCSSDLARPRPLGLVLVQALTARREIESAGIVDTAGLPGLRLQPAIEQIGRASGRERVCQYVSISVVAVSLKKKKTTTQPSSNRQEYNISQRIPT